MPKSNITCPPMACFAKLESLIGKAEPSNFSVILEQFKIKQNEIQKAHNTQLRKHIRKQEQLKRLKAEADEYQRQIDELNSKAEEECKKLRQAILVQENLNKSLQGHKFECIICWEHFDLVHVVSCPDCNKQICFQCFERLDDRVYGGAIKKKICGNCRYVFATVEVKDTFANNDLFFGNDAHDGTSDDDGSAEYYNDDYESSELTSSSDSDCDNNDPRDHMSRRLDVLSEQTSLNPIVVEDIGTANGRDQRLRLGTESPNGLDSANNGSGSPLYSPHDHEKKDVADNE